LQAHERPGAQFKFVFFGGSPLRPNRFQQEQHPIERIPGEPNAALVRCGQHPFVVQLTRRGEVPRNFVLSPGTTLRVRAQTDRQTEIGVEFGHPYADRLAQLKVDLRLAELMEAIASMREGNLVELAKRHPSAALIVGYALLRGGEPEVRDQALAILSDALPTLPDTQVIVGEREARRGEVESAIRRFLVAEELGLPGFSVGFGYLCDRLRFYARAAEQIFNESSVEEGIPTNAPAALFAHSKALRAAISRLEPFAMATDFGFPLTVYTGNDPLNPSGAVLTSKGFNAVGAETMGLTEEG
jgi:hypothetical protein